MRNSKFFLYWFSFFLVVAVFYSFTLGAEENLKGKTWQLTLPSTGTVYESSLKNFLDNAENVYIPFFTALGLRRTRERQLKIRVFANQDDFKIYQRSHSKSVSNYAFYSLFDAEVVTYDNGNLPLLLSNVFHESAHHYIRDFIPQENIFRCLDEGVAEIFEVGQLEGSRFLIGDYSVKWADLISQAASQSKLMPFSFFISMSPKEYVEYQNSSFPDLQTAQCWALSFFLYYSTSGEWRSVLAGLLTSDRSSEKVTDLITKSLPKGRTITEMEEMWLKFTLNPR